jgi:predicted DCC family thiol-disulfide oxidoreductase YuxK
MTATTHIVLWDGECGMCRRYADAIQAADTTGTIETVPYQVWTGPEMNEAFAADCARALHVRTMDGRMLRGADAVLFTYQILGWRLAAVVRMRPFIWPVELLYKIVAANRYVFSKLFYTGGDGLNATCKLEYPEDMTADQD